MSDEGPSKTKAMWNLLQSFDQEFHPELLLGSTDPVPPCSQHPTGCWSPTGSSQDLSRRCRSGARGVGYREVLGSLGKALGSAIGGFVAGTLAALDILENDSGPLTALHTHVHTVKKSSHI
ncbi:hypothetical protein [Actinomadura rudentiformis]|uniref:hypothetical protein n=1 Tax=Actinomadura rudentiformis TaxID=359158 RepID=UPI00178C61D1|nr:hypothetical protein [Actinomadura rudentiformis]